MVIGTIVLFIFYGKFLIFRLQLGHIICTEVRIMQNRTAQRISLSLSLEAYSTILADMDIFQNENNLDGFINKILMNYKEISDASISLAKERERNKYISWIKTASGAEKISAEDSACLERLVEGYTKELTIKMNSYKNGVQLKPRINNENYDDLKLGTPAFQEEEYYRREGKYIKAILEEYALLTFYEREGVFFKDIIDCINEAIAMGNVLKLKYVNRKQQQTQIAVRPYKIASSPLLQYHYLVALPADTETNKDILVLRVSRITESKKLSRTSHITIHEQKHIDEVIRTKGIQYIVSQDSEIKVALTEQGYKLYKSILYLRPKYTSITKDKEKWVLTFMCAEEQIKNYFFQFGKEAIVLFPDNLKQWFLDKYTDAVNTYL